MIADGDLSDSLSILARRFIGMPSRAAFGKTLMVIAVTFLLFSTLSLLVGPSAQDRLAAPEEELAAGIEATGTPPQFVIFLPALTSTNKGDVTNFTIYVRDVDNDTINVTWDFGDGTPLAYNTTLPAAAMLIVKVSHVYDPYYPGQGFDFPFPGPFIVNYTVNVTLDDGNGNSVYRTGAVSVNMPENSPPSAPTVVGPPGTVDPLDSVTIAANTSDPEGDELWWTYVFNNTVEDYLIVTNHTPRTAPGTNVWANESIAFGIEGSFKVSVFVSDAPEPYQFFPHNLSDSFGPIRAIFNRVPNATDEISASPPSPIINATIGYIEVTYMIDAFDQDGDFLNATWNFGDGTDNVTNMSAGGTGRYVFQQVRNYTDAGVFNITVLVTDGRPGHEVLLNLTMTVMSTNRPPELKNFSYTYVTGNFALPNETLNFTLKIYDDERDPIEVIVDWGDNSTWEFYNLTAFVDKNVTLLLNHTYTSVGKYNITIWYTDHKIGLFEHNKNLTNLVKVEIPPPIVHHYWSWWDFTSLFLFIMIPVSFILRFYQVARQRRRLEEEGLTLEEWKLVKSEMGKDVTAKEEP